jgi:heme oxygenase (mycobilin-producing)
MAIKVIIARRVPSELKAEAGPLINELRKGALQQPGYISGESLVNTVDPEEHLVISTWASVEDWNAWFFNPLREELQLELDELLEEGSQYAVYQNG